MVIDSRPETKRFSELADPWQWEMAAHYSLALEDIAGIRSYKGPRNFWFGMPRGHDKTSSIARAACWVLAFSKKRLSGVVAAADAEQAGFILDAMNATVRLNPWIGDKVTVGANKAVGPGGKVKIVAADAASAFGMTEDLFILDELTHWKKRDLWGAIWSGRIKRPDSVAIIITNAGVIRTWQDEVHKEAVARHGKDWFVFDLPQYTKLSSWMKQSDWDGLRAFLTKGEAKRVLDNVWIDPNEDSGWVTYAEAMACWDSSLPLHTPKRQPGFVYKAGIDYGPKKDRTALCVLHADPGTESVVVDRLDVWQGSQDSPVKIADVERWIDEVAIGEFNADLVVDPYQMEGTIQKYEHRRKVTRFESRGGKANYELAECLRHLLVNKKLRYHPSAGSLVKAGGGVETLTDELGQLVVKPTQYGYRIEHHTYKANEPPKFVCHDDRAVSVGMAALEAVRDFTQGFWVAPVNLLHPSNGGNSQGSTLAVDRSKMRELIQRFDPANSRPTRPMLGVGSIPRRR